MEEDGVAVVAPDRCVGCGVCVASCESGAIGLVLKPEEERGGQPTTSMEMAMGMAQARGKTLSPLFSGKTDAS